MRFFLVSGLKFEYIDDFILYIQNEKKKFIAEKLWYLRWRWSESKLSQDCYIIEFLPGKPFKILFFLEKTIQ